MLSSITPLGERGRQRSWKVTVVAFFLGALSGGALIGGVLGAAGALAGAVRPWLAAVVLAAAALVEPTPAAEHLPALHRQVNEDWLARYRGWVVGLGFGFQLGLGVVTFITTPLVYAALGLALLSGSPAGGALVGAAFGLGRALTLLTTARVGDLDSLSRYHRRLERMYRPARWTAAGLTALLAVLVVWP